MCFIIDNFPSNIVTYNSIDEYGNFAMQKRNEKNKLI